MPRQNRKQAYEDAKKQADAAGLCVADVVKVLAFDEAALTVDVQPITRYPDEDTFQTKPPVLAVPVATIYGGGFVIRPVYKAGDIGVVVYLDRDSDAVIAGGAEADPNTERLHSGDDAVFVGGIRTGGSSISGLPAGSLSLGTSDGGVYLSISPSGIDIKGNVTITGDLTTTGGTVNLNCGRYALCLEPHGKGTPYKAPQRGSTTDTPPRTVPSLSRERSPAGAPGTFSSTDNRRPTSEAPRPKMTPAAGAAKGASPRAAEASSSTESPPPVSGTPWPPTTAPGPSPLAAGTF